MLRSSETMKKGLSSYWKWAYNLKSVLEDDSNSSITVQLTSISAEVHKIHAYDTLIANPQTSNKLCIAVATMCM